jgi:hypothetical protein
MLRVQTEPAELLFRESLVKVLPLRGFLLIPVCPHAMAMTMVLP